MGLIPPLMRSAERLKFVDVTDDRKIHVGVVPRIGGIAMVAGTVLPMLMWLQLTRQITAFLIGVAIIAVFGAWDDRKNLDYRVKFFGQFLAVAFVVWYGDVLIRFVPFGEQTELHIYASVILTGFVLLGITNAVNLADGLDGLAGGIMLLSFGAIALLAYVAHNLDVLLIAIAISGGILGFLRFNTYPARIFMGDTGSQFLGFSVGILAIALTQEPHAQFSPSLPLLLLGLPILDTAMVMGQRIAQGRSPFSPDKNHIHHKLLAIGFDHYEAVFLIYVVQAGLVIAAYLLQAKPDGIILAFYGLFCMSVLAMFRIVGSAGWHPHANREKTPSWVSDKARALAQGGLLARTAYVTAGAGVAGYLLISVAVVERVSTDVFFLAISLLVISLLAYLAYRGKALSLLERATLYVLCTLVVYLTRMSPQGLPNFGHLQNIFFVVLAVTIIIGLRFSKDKEFEITPLDFLIIFLAFTIPYLPDPRFQELRLGEAIARLIVLFYAVESVLANTRRHDGIRFVMWLVLGGLSLKVLL